MEDKCHEFPYLVTLCFILNDKGEVLLQKKARGFGQGNWNGPGGKIKPGESPVEGVIREVAEETGLVLFAPEQAGELEFVVPHREEINNYCYVFRAHYPGGEPKDLGEGELRWFPLDKIPLKQMWDDDQYWLPAVLAGGYVKKRFYFGTDNKVYKQIEL
jgi:8-oxo-dGTP diphosphatase